MADIGLHRVYFALQKLKLADKMFAPCCRLAHVKQHLVLIFALSHAHGKPVQLVLHFFEPLAQHGNVCFVALWEQRASVKVVKEGQKDSRWQHPCLWLSLGRTSDSNARRRSRAS